MKKKFSSSHFDWHYVLTFATAALYLAACSSPNEQPLQYQLVVVDQGAGTVSFYNPTDESLLGQVEVGYNPHEVEVSGNGKTAYVSNFGIEDYDHTMGIPGVSISVIDIPAMAERTRFFTNRQANGEPDTSQAGPNRAPHGVKLRPPKEKELFVNVEVGDSMLVFDPATGLITRSFPVPTGTHNFIFSPQGDTLWLFAGPNGIFRINPDTGEETGHFPTGSPARGIIYSAETGRLIVSCENEIYQISLRDLSVSKHFRDLGVKQIIYSGLSPDGKFIMAPCPYDSQVLVVDRKTGHVLHRLTTGKAPIYVQVAPSGTEAFISNALDDHLSVIDLENFAVRPFGGSNRPNGLVFVAVNAK